MSGEFAVPTSTRRDRKVADGKKRYVLNEVTPAANAAAAITDTTDRLILRSTSAAVVAISTTSAREGQRVSIFLIEETSTGSATLAVTGGTLTFAVVNAHALVE